MALTQHGTLDIPTIIAHRGFSSEAPENTLAAISLAAERGLKWVEVDIKISADGVLLLCHDEELERTTNGTGKISETNWYILSKLDAGSWFDDKFQEEPLPSLEKVLQCCEKHHLGINLELKPIANTLQQMSAAITPIIKKYQQRGVPILVSSFNKTIIRNIHETVKTIGIGYLIDKNDSDREILNFIKEVQPISIHIPESKCSPKIVQQLNQFGLKILVYTVNNQARAEALFKMGVVGIFSDFDLTI